jgi:hypothetical protein
MKERFIKSGSKKLLDKVFGSGKEKLLIYPGFPGVNENLPLLENMVKNGFECHSISYSGIRKSSGEFSFLDAVKDSIVAAKDVKPNLILGYSYGALYAWHASLSSPPNLLILIEPVTEVDALWRYYDSRNKKYIEKLMLEAKEVARGDWKKWIMEQDEMQKYSPILSEMPKCKVICIQGDSDTEIPLEMTKTFCEKRGVDLHILEGCGHYLEGFHSKIGGIILQNYKN